MTTKKKETAVAKAAPSAVTVPEEYQAFAGQGWDNVTSADIAIPFLNLLQDGSPQVKKASSERIDGAEAGFFHDSVSNELYGDDGVIIVPVLTEPKVVEWIPRTDDGGGGGFVDVHEWNGDVHKAALARASGNRTEMTNEDGSTELKETFYMYALILADEDAIEPSNSGVMISFSRSKIKPYRIGMGRINKVKGSASLPLFCNRLRLTAVADTGKGNDFFNVKLEPIVTDKGDDSENVISSRIAGTLDGQPHPLLLVAQKFYEGLIGGTVKVDYAQDSEDSAKKGDGAEVKDGHF